MTAGVAEMIKPWQRASLGLAGVVLGYLGLLTFIENRVTLANQQSAKKVQIESRSQQLEATLKNEQSTLEKLQQSIQSVQHHTTATKKQIAKVKGQMALIQRGIVTASQPLPNIPAPSVSHITIPSTATPPPVQTTTRASGV